MSQQYKGDHGSLVPGLCQPGRCSSPSLRGPGCSHRVALRVQSFDACPTQAAHQRFRIPSTVIEGGPVRVTERGGGGGAGSAGMRHGWSFSREKTPYQASRLGILMDVNIRHVIFGKARSNIYWYNIHDKYSATIDIRHKSDNGGTDV